MNRCKIKIHEGKVVIGKENVRDLVRSKKDGYYSLTIKEWDRSIEQNNTMWMWIEIIRKHHGYTKQEMYDALVEAYSWNYTYRDMNGKPKQKKVTTSMMSVTEMTAFMESIIQHAAEENINLPMPDEKEVA